MHKPRTTEEDLRRMAVRFLDGTTYQELAAERGVTKQRIYTQLAPYIGLLGQRGSERRLTRFPDRAAAIRDAIDEGHSLVEIARNLSLSIRTVRRYSKLMNAFQASTTKHRKFLVRFNRYRDWLEEGRSYAQIARYDGIRPKTVNVFCLKHGLREKQEVKRPGRKVPENRRAMWQRMLKNGYTAKDIAQRYKLRLSSVYKWSADNNLNLFARKPKGTHADIA